MRRILWQKYTPLVGLLLFPIAAQAKSKNIEVMPKAQTQAFALGYALGTCNVCAEVFIHSVVNLKKIDDPQAANDEIVALSRQIPLLRQAQALAYGQAAKLLTGQNATVNNLRTWAIQSSLRFSGDLLYSPEERKIARTDSSTATVLAELDELQAMRTDADAHHSKLSLWMRVSARAPGVWSSEIGAYAAGLDARITDASVAPLPSTAATQSLLDTAPVGTPAPIVAALTSLLPPGGNLRGLATVPPQNVSVQKLNHAYQILMTAFDARKLADALDKTDR